MIGVGQTQALRVGERPVVSCPVFIKLNFFNQSAGAVLLTTGKGCHEEKNERQFKFSGHFFRLTFPRSVDPLIIMVRN